MKKIANVWTERSLHKFSFVNKKMIESTWKYYVPIYSLLIVQPSLKPNIVKVFQIKKTRISFDIVFRH